jgi:Spy/CpxP family protein refolding chaperone
MLRKTIFAIAAVATLTATALVPTTASAKNFKGGWGHHHHGWGIGGLVIGSAAVASSCYQYGWYRGVYTRYWVCD